VISPNQQRILIIDDNPSIHEDFRKILSGRWANQDSLSAKDTAFFGDEAPEASHDGFQIDSAYQGQEGLDRVLRAHDEGQPYSLTFIDVRMPPGWDGVETLERIFPADPDVHAVICSAYSDYSANEILTRFRASNRLLMLRKPCDSADILLIARIMCEKWRLSQYSGSNFRRASRPSAACTN